jgi:hypothetical protein
LKDYRQEIPGIGFRAVDDWLFAIADCRDARRLDIRRQSSACRQKPVHDFVTNSDRFVTAWEVVLVYPGPSAGLETLLPQTFLIDRRAQFSSGR